MIGLLQLLSAVLLALLCHSASADPFTPKHIPSASSPIYVLQLNTGDGLEEFVTVSLIGYCGGDPVNNIDPMGTRWRKISGAWKWIPDLDEPDEPPSGQPMPAAGMMSLEEFLTSGAQATVATMNNVYLNPSESSLLKQELFGGAAWTGKTWTAGVNAWANETPTMFNETEKYGAIAAKYSTDPSAAEVDAWSTNSKLAKLKLFQKRNAAFALYRKVYGPVCSTIIVSSQLATIGTIGRAPTTVTAGQQLALAAAQTRNAATALEVTAAQASSRYFVQSAIAYGNQLRQLNSIGSLGPNLSVMRDTVTGQSFKALNSKTPFDKSQLRPIVAARYDQVLAKINAGELDYNKFVPEHLHGEFINASNALKARQNLGMQVSEDSLRELEVINIILKNNGELETRPMCPGCGAGFPEIRDLHAPTP